jgi:hypothetical protein
MEYEIKYYKKVECLMKVKAESEEEAKIKYENFDCISDYEVQGIEEKVIYIKKTK